MARSRGAQISVVKSAPEYRERATRKHTRNRAQREDQRAESPHGCNRALRLLKAGAVWRVRGGMMPKPTTAVTSSAALTNSASRRHHKAKAGRTAEVLVRYGDYS